jgi:hypothetical protein
MADEIELLLSTERKHLFDLDIEWDLISVRGCITALDYTLLRPRLGIAIIVSPHVYLKRRLHVTATAGEPHLRVEVCT